MSRLARLIVPGFPHHVTQRGNRRAPVFFEQGDYALYRDLLAERCRKASNSLLAGWLVYFSYGTLAPTYRAVDRHVCVRRFLARRHKIDGRGARGFSLKVIFGELGVYRLTRIRSRAAAVSLP